ncbi:hypothetical protein QNH14_14120 [Apirhabdus apintestini]|nr:hypothetical protein QNH14_14120 [Enterobacteriaceae bacterium CA-0114]
MDTGTAHRLSTHFPAARFATVAGAADVASWPGFSNWLMIEKG